MELGNIFYKYVSVKVIALFFYFMHVFLVRVIIN